MEINPGTTEGGSEDAITELIGDVTATGPGIATATLATVNSNVGSFTNANITVNAKGLVTAASNGTAGTVTSVAMTVPTGLTISGSPVTTTGTLAVALDTGYVIPLQATLDGFAVKSGSLTQFVGNTAWRVFYSDGSGDITELALGADGTFLKSNGAAAIPSFAVPAGSGDVTKVGTPVNNQVGVWTGDGTIEGDADLTFDTTTNTLATVDLSLSNDLLLASASVINFDGGDVTITHSANTLTFAGGTIALGTATATGGLTGNVTGNVSGSAATVTTAAQPAITSLGTLTVLQVDNINIDGNTIISSNADGNINFTPNGTGLNVLANAQVTSLTASEIVITDASKNLVSAAVATYPSLTELTYVKGVTSAIQTQLGTKVATATTITIAGTANQITSSAGAQDLSANRTWTLSLPADVIIPTVLTVPNTGLHLLDTNASHDLIVKPGSNITADRTLTITTGDTDMIVDFTAVTDEFVLAYDTGTNTWRGVVSSGGGTVDTVVGTSNRITVDATDPANPIVDIAATYVGQASITTLGTVGTGVWQGTTIKANYLQQAAADLGDADITVDFTNSNAGNVTNLIIDGALTIASMGGDWTNAGRTVADAGTLTTVDINGGTVDGVTIGGASAGAVTGTTITANTGFMPDANDGAYLGQAGTAFSDLFLAEGGVINWDSGDATITQTGNVLAVAGADFRIATADVGTNADSVPTLSSTSTFTNKTLTSPTLTTPSAFTTGGTITLAENTSVALDPAGSADGKYTGITVTGVSGYTQAFGDLVTLDKDDSRWEAVDISVAAAATGDARGLLGMVVATGTDGNACTILLNGIIRADANFPALTIGAPVYASTSGDIVVAQPTTTDYVIRIVGSAVTADEIYFNPQNGWTTHT